MHAVYKLIFSFHIAYFADL